MEEQKKLITLVDLELNKIEFIRSIELLDLSITTNQNRTNPHRFQIFSGARFARRPEEDHDR